jgi:hypothetical protein
VPVLGFLILFNHAVVDALAIAPEVLARLFGEKPSMPPSIATGLTLNRLYFLYYGLSLIGFASGIYYLRCPNLLKRYSDLNEYIEKESELATGRITEIIVDELVQALKYRVGPIEQMHIFDPDSFAANFRI